MANILVTGANRGIGLELCRQLKNRGDDIIAACRTTSEELLSLGVQVEEGVELSSADSIMALGQRLKGQQLDLVIHNAGVLRRNSLDALDFDSIQLQMEINAYGPLRLSHALLSNLGAGGKIAIVTSRMGSVEDNTSGGLYGYRMSKAAVNMVGRSLAVDLRGRGIAVVLLHPGYVKTGMTGHSGHITPAQSAEGLINRIDDLNLDNSGRFFHQNGDELPW